MLNRLYNYWLYGGVGIVFLHLMLVVLSFGSWGFLSFWTFLFFIAPAGYEAWQYYQTKKIARNYHKKFPN